MTWTGAATCALLNLTVRGLSGSWKVHRKFLLHGRRGPFLRVHAIRPCGLCRWIGAHACPFYASARFVRAPVVVARLATDRTCEDLVDATDRVRDPLHRDYAVAGSPREELLVGDVMKHDAFEAFRPGRLHEHQASALGSCGKLTKPVGFCLVEQHRASLCEPCDAGQQLSVPNSCHSHELRLAHIGAYDFVMNSTLFHRLPPYMEPAVVQVESTTYEEKGVAHSQVASGDRG